MARMTREERRAHTRSCLMAAAGKIFSSQGLQQASIDDVAEEAGFTKGAFYANFRSKEELFLAMLDERFAARLEQIERVLATEHGLEDQTRRAGADYVAAMRADPEWERLFFEFAAYAARNADFREELVTRYRSLREAIATALGRAKEHHGGEAAMDLEQVSLMLFAISNGFALEKLLEGDAIDDDLYGTMLLVFFTGLRALAEERAGQRAPAPS
jgi:AcrR family transcriptional regulator